jgi:hypothetical protein
MTTTATQTKRCYRCGEEKEKSDAEFYRNAARRDGWSGSCKACDHKYWRKRSERDKEQARRRQASAQPLKRDPNARREISRDLLADRLGLDVGSQLAHWTEGRIISAIKAWEKRTGEPPTSKQWQKPTRLGESFLKAGRVASRPASTTVARRFGSWNAAIAAAGFEPRQPGHPRVG